MVGGIVFFVNLWIRFVESMIREKQERQPKKYSAAALFSFFFFYGLYIYG